MPPSTLLRLCILVTAVLSGCTGRPDDLGASTEDALSNTDPTTLDPSGQSLPDVNYAVPVGALFISSEQGSDASSGLQSAPLRTLEKALSLVHEGGAIVARQGVYREGNLVSRKSFRLQSYPHETVWFEGAAIVPTASWVADGQGHFYLPWSTPDFCQSAEFPTGGYYHQVWPWKGTPGTDGPCLHADMGAGAENPASADPQMVFMDETYLPEVTTLAQVQPGTFFYDFDQRRIYLGSNPANHQMKVTKFPYALHLQGATHEVFGVGFRYYAGNEKGDGSVTRAALLIESEANTIVANSVFYRNAGAGLGVSSGPKNLAVKHNVFAYNGFDGVSGNGNEAHENMVVANNVFNVNNDEKFGSSCSASCSMAGMKLSHMQGTRVDNNIFENAQGPGMGIWFDVHCLDSTITRNVVRGNGGIGIMYEISDHAVIASNMVYGNTGPGIKVKSPHVVVANNTVVDNGTTAEMIVFDDPKAGGMAGVYAFGPDTRDVMVVNNIFADTLGSYALLVAKGNQTQPEDFFSPATFHDNFYWRTQQTPDFLMRWQPSGAPETDFATALELTAGKGLDLGAVDVVSATDPYFTDSAHKDYSVRANGRAYHRGGVMPPSAVDALGLSKGTGLSPGAISWPR